MQKCLVFGWCHFCFVLFFEFFWFWVFLCVYVCFFDCFSEYQYRKLLDLVISLEIKLPTCFPRIKSKQPRETSTPPLPSPTTRARVPHSLSFLFKGQPTLMDILVSFLDQPSDKQFNFPAGNCPCHILSHCILVESTTPLCFDLAHQTIPFLWPQ